MGRARRRAPEVEDSAARFVTCRLSVYYRCTVQLLSMYCWSFVGMLSACCRCTGASAWMGTSTQVCPHWLPPSLMPLLSTTAINKSSINPHLHLPAQGSCKLRMCKIRRCHCILCPDQKNYRQNIMTYQIEQVCFLIPMTRRYSAGQETILETLDYEK